MTELEKIVLNDGSLKEDKEKKQLFKTYAVLFSQDFVVNLDLTSIELDEKYLTNNPVSWRKFLNHTSIRKFIGSFQMEKAEKQADLTLAAGTAKTNEALKVKQMVDSKKRGDDNSNLVVVFLPQKRRH